MKNTLIKILGVVMALAMLSGLIVAYPVSVSAAKLSWSNVKTPQVSVGTDANVFCFSADGKSAWLYTAGLVDDEGYVDAYNPDTPVIPVRLYKSTDGGITWSYSSMDTNKTLAGANLQKIVVSQDNDNYLFAWGYTGADTNAWRSTNGGAKWSVFNPNPDGVITDIDIATDGDGDPAYLIGYEDGLALYDSSIFGSWEDTTGGMIDTDFPGDAVAVAFSPDYENDALLVIVTSTGEVATILVYDDGSSTWNDDYEGVQLTAGASGDEADAIAPVKASIAFPSNYSTTSSYNKIFVGIGDPDAETTDALGVYRVWLKSSGSKEYFLGEYNVCSLDFKGTLSSGTLAFAQYGDNAILTRTDAASADDDDWVTSAETNSSPIGTNGTVQFSAAEDKLYVGTVGTQSALFVSVNADYTAFAGISFFKFSSFKNAFVGGGVVGGGRSSITAETQYQLMADLDKSQKVLFKSTDSGNTWKSIFYTPNFDAFAAAGIDAVAPTADGAIYLKFSDVNGSIKKFARSNDAGMTWSVLTNKEAIDSLAAIDGTTYWVGSSSGIRKSTSSTYAKIEGSNAFIMIPIPGFFVCTTTQGEIFLSTDSGASFQRLGDKDTFNGSFLNAKWTMDMATKTFYAVSTDSQAIVKWTVGEDTAWTVVKNYAELVSPKPEGDDITIDYDSPLNNAKSPFAGPTKGITGLSRDGATGVWYITSTGNLYGQVWRSTDLVNEKFEPVMSTKPADIKGSINGAPELNMYVNADGATVLWTCINKTTYATNNNGTPNDATDDYVQPISPNYYPYQLISFIDTVLPALTTTAPVAGSTVGNTITTLNGVASSTDFSWKGIASTYKNAEYQIQVAYDQDFGDIAYNVNGEYLDIEEIKGTSKTAVALPAGKTFFWRVRVTYPMASKWSVPVSFSTNLSSDVNPGINAEGRIYPVNGASNVSIKPALTWGSVAGATSYDIKLANDAAFTSIVEEKSGLTSTAFSPSAPLKENTTYFWEVRAVSGASAGQWVVSAFTTAAAGTGPLATMPAPVVTVNVPTQAAQPAPVITVNAPPVTVNVAPAAASTTTPETPAYIWVIIAVGAILVIAVIVLIARTRRV